MQRKLGQHQRASLQRLKTGLKEWTASDGASWLYIGNVLLAAFLALGVAMRLELASPRTAMTTVFIVMQPQSGAVLAKSFYRLCGTVTGLISVLVIISLFPQQPELFIVGLAVWIGVCTAGAARNRNFRSYGFVLAGYTAALVGVPAWQNPDGAFLSAMNRWADVALGVVCAGAVSALVFPIDARRKMAMSIEARFNHFIDHVRDTVCQSPDPKRVGATHLALISDVIGFETARSSWFFEGPEARRSSRRLARLNSEFMLASTRLHALAQLIGRLDAAASEQTLAVLRPWLETFAALLERSRSDLSKPADVRLVLVELQTLRDSLRASGRSFEAQSFTEQSAIDLELVTGLELFSDFLTDFHELATTYVALLNDDVGDRDDWVGKHVQRTSLSVAAISGVRAALVVIALSTFWIQSAWPSGAMLTLVGATICALVSSSSYPGRTAYQMAGGTFAAVVCGMVVNFGIFPLVDGFPLLCAVLAPFFLVGIWVATRSKLAGYGVGFCIFFCFMAVPDNPTRYEPVTFINDGIAIVLSMVCASLAYSLLFPMSMPWLRRHLITDLRARVAFACRRQHRWGTVPIRTMFESQVREAAHQLLTVCRNTGASEAGALTWLFSVMEIGSAVIDIRGLAFQGGKRVSPSVAGMRTDFEKLFSEIATLFTLPKRSNYRNALQMVDNAISAAHSTLISAERMSSENAESAPNDGRARGILARLHFIRTALLDEQSPFATFR